jgi:hypothetical protein
MMREPDVRSSLLYDIYLSPLERKVAPAQHTHHDLLVIQKGETKEISGVAVHFIGFDMGMHEQGGPMKVGARLEIAVNGSKYTLTPAVTFEQSARKSEPAVFKRNQDGETGEVMIHLNSINSETGKRFSTG